MQENVQYARVGREGIHGSVADNYPPLPQGVTLDTPLSARQVAEYLGVHYRSITERLSEGVIHGVFGGKSYTLTWRDVQQSRNLPLGKKSGEHWRAHRERAMRLAGLRPGNRVRRVHQQTMTGTVQGVWHRPVESSTRPGRPNHVLTVRVAWDNGKIGDTPARKVEVVGAA